MRARRILFCGIGLILLALLHSCYKDDVQDLYSRQYVTSVGLKELDEKAEAINKEIKEIRTLIEKIKLGEPTTKVEYNVVDGDTLGVYLYYGKEKVYVPFGKKGKDGTQITIGEDGYWYINGEKTDKKADGKDGCTPQIGVAQDPDNTSDTKLYWQVTWCDGTKKFILHNGEKVPARGEDGKPGVVNPIKKIEVKDGKVIITTTYEAPNDVITIPLSIHSDANTTPLLILESQAKADDATKWTVKLKSEKGAVITISSGQLNDEKTHTVTEENGEIILTIDRSMDKDVTYLITARKEGKERSIPKVVTISRSPLQYQWVFHTDKIQRAIKDPNGDGLKLVEGNVSKEVFFIDKRNGSQNFVIHTNREKGRLYIPFEAKGVYEVEISFSSLPTGGAQCVCNWKDDKDYDKGGYFILGGNRMVLTNNTWFSIIIKVVYKDFSYKKYHYDVLLRENGDIPNEWKQHIQE